MVTAVAFRTNCRRRATVSATDEFWFSPASHELPTSPADDDCDELGDSDENSSTDSDSDMIMLPLPPAHDQLLSDEPPSRLPLGGYDHTARSIGHANAYGDYGFHDDDDDVDGEAALDAPVGRVRRRLSAVQKREGGGSGSWLLDFARLGGGGGDKVPSSEEEEPAPGLVREESDEESSASDSDVDDASSSSSDEHPKRKRSGGVSFSPSVTVRPVPHSDALSPAQRRRMYTTTLEVRRNKIRNKREYRYDGCDWRNATEEWEMGVDMVTGELVHPAHEAHLRRGPA